MKTKLKYLVGLALPLTFAPANSQDFELNKLNVKNIDSLFSEPIKIPEATIIQEKSKVTKNKYNMDLCIGDKFENERFSVRYNNFNNGLKIGYFYHLDKTQSPETEGGIGVKMSSTTFESNGTKPIGYRKFETHPREDTTATWEFSINKRYDQNGKRNCVNMDVLLTENRKFSFGDYLPGKPSKN